MTKTLKNTPVIPATPVTPDTVTKEVTTHNFIFTLTLKLLRWVLNKIIQIITLLSSKSTTLASLFDPIIKHLGFLLTIAKYFKLFEFFHYFRFILKLIASFNLFLSILVLFSFSDFNLDFISNIFLISPVLFYFYDLNYFSESVEWFKFYIRKAFSVLLDTLQQISHDKDIKISHETVPNNIEGYADYHYSDKKPIFSIGNFLILIFFFIFFGGIYYNWNDPDYVNGGNTGHHFVYLQNMISDSFHWISDTFHRIFSGNNPGNGPDTGSVGSSTPTNSTKPNLGVQIPNVTTDNPTPFQHKDSLQSPIIPNTPPRYPSTPTSAAINPWGDPNSTPTTPTSTSTNDGFYDTLKKNAQAKGLFNSNISNSKTPFSDLAVSNAANISTANPSTSNVGIFSSSFQDAMDTTPTYSKDYT